MEFSELDNHFMLQALQLADRAAQEGEVPVGAVIVNEHNEVIGEGYNQPIIYHDPTAHAEIVALRAAAKTLANYRLLNTTLYVTLEPCSMCAGAIIHSRVKRVVYAIRDPRTGASGSMFDILNTNKLNHRVEVESGLLGEVSSKKLKTFFAEKRRVV